MHVIGCELPCDEKAEFSHISRFCYRRAFPPINPGKITSDRGWGCCYRCFQGVLSNYLDRLKKDSPELFESKFVDTEALTLFHDLPTAPFGIQKFVYETAKIGTPIGKWTKLSTLSYTLKDMFKEYDLKVVMSKSMMLTEEEMEIGNNPAIVLITCLLGMRQLDTNYLPFLRACLDHPNSLGIVSGKNDSAYYLVGYSESSFLYFDPHTTKKCVDKSSRNETYFKLALKKIRQAKINPSVLISFYVKNQEEMIELATSIKGYHGSPIEISNEREINEIESQVFDPDIYVTV